MSPAATSHSKRSASTSSGATVAGRRLLHGRRVAQSAPCPGDEGLQRVRQVRRQVIPPDRLDEHGRAHRASAGERQPGDEVTQASTGHAWRVAGVVPYLEGARERYLHHVIVAGPYEGGGERRFCGRSAPGRAVAGSPAGRRPKGQSRAMLTRNSATTRWSALRKRRVNYRVVRIFRVICRRDGGEGCVCYSYGIWHVRDVRVHRYPPAFDSTGRSERYC
jgi:hypothetical protein